MRDEDRPVQSAGLETREGNMITLGFAAVIALSFLPFADLVFVPLLGLIVASVLWVFVKALWAATTLDHRLAYGSLTPAELAEQSESIEQAIRDGHVRAGDVVADGILVTQRWVDDVLTKMREAQ